MNHIIEIKDKLKELQVNINDNYANLADLLYEIWTNKYYKEYDYSSFREFVDSVLDLNPRKAIFLVNFKDKLLKLNKSWDDVKDIGWRKLATIYSILTQDNFKHWINLAHECSLKELSEHVKAYKEGSFAPKEPKTRMYFQFSEEELSIVQSALEEAKRQANTTSNSVAIKNICYEWYQNLDLE
ncbi:hypothetical protein [Thermoanaerobacter sp. A7A]|uniref:hypothetical protein n=1 Tax=Thermoanaerobacter sp. A7A TaxID=1350366 RepID=UPI0004138BB1|nr:hypothetical protein [Thermoanaerobacter sp. A7A]